MAAYKTGAFVHSKYYTPFYRTPLKWIPRSSKSRPCWAAHTRIGNVWEYPPRASRFNFRCEVFDIRGLGPWNGTTLRCWPKILHRKNYGDKKGSKSFQQQRKMFCRKFGWPSMKVLQIKVRRLKLFRCSLKLLANVQCTSTRKRSV